MSEPAASLANLPEFSVSEIAAALKRTVEDRFPFVRVRGEISGLKFHSSGHVYFDLKDEKAVLNAVVWRGQAQKLKFRPEGGAEVICTGRISTYPGSSRYQIIVEQVELAGLGALMAMLEERKKRLAAEGLFDESCKRPLPYLPDVIGVITSPTGAVIRDIMHRLNARFPRRVLVWPVAVQGERAASEVATAIAGFNALKDGDRLPRPDLIIVARGGGSIEDLMAFNEEAVVRAVAAGTIPLISAVGHETDTTLIDFVSDRRAPTPTAAAEMAVPVQSELRGVVLDLERRRVRSIGRAMQERKLQLQNLGRHLARGRQSFETARQRLDQQSDKLGAALMRNLEIHRRKLLAAGTLLRAKPIADSITRDRQKLTASGAQLGRCFNAFVGNRRRDLLASSRMLETTSYRGILSRGFALVRGEDGSLRRSAGDVRQNEKLILTFGDGDRAAIAADGEAPEAESPIRKVQSPSANAKKPSGTKKSGQGTLF